MKHIIIGTAGHVDHGKSLLIKALTGVETDRLREEKERGISIELGFASLTLPSGRRAGIVDVPGHERFIKNMLAGAGQRVAVNLTGVETGQIKRGSVVSSPGALVPSYCLDAKLRLLENIKKSLQHRARVRLHVGTAEILGRVILLDRDELLPGEQSYVQLHLEETAAAGKGERFAIRSYSPMHTIGGGTIIDANPQRHKRFKPEVIEALVTKEKGTPEELVFQYLVGQQIPVLITEIAGEVALAVSEAEQALNKLSEQNKVKVINADSKKWRY